MSHIIDIRPAVDERPGWTEVNLAVDNQAGVSTCGILALKMRVGAAIVRMDGIGGVETMEAHRNRGYARQVLDAAIAHMTAGDAALTMLYGITNFYPKFGFATAGPDYLLELPAPPAHVPIPAGWRARAFEPNDLLAIRHLYDQAITGTSGAAVRDPAAYPWTRLRDVRPEERWNECRVVVDAADTLRGYAWRGTGCGFVPEYTRDAPGKLVLGEIIAADPPAADVLLDVCGNWARDEAARRSEPVSHVTTVVPPEGMVAGAAMTRSATFRQEYVATGGSMVRVLDVGRLCRALLPEFRQRLAAAPRAWAGTLQIVTEIGAATLAVEHDNIEVLDHAPDGAYMLHLPQPTLARLALGAQPPRDALARLPSASPATIADVVATLFPQRHPHMFLVDRY